VLTEQKQEKLSRSEDECVRAHLAKNPALTERVQDVLAKDKDRDVRAGNLRFGCPVPKDKFSHFWSVLNLQP